MASTPATVLEALKQRARDTPSAAAFVVDGERVSYLRLRRQAADLARRLSRIGLRRGERCIIALTSPLDTIRLCYACHMLAATPVVLDAGKWTLQRERRIRGAQPAMVIADLPSRRNTPVGTRPLEIAFEFLQHVTPSPSSCLATPAPDEAAYLQFTSGTMGEAKAAVVSHRALVAALEAMQQRYAFTARDVVAARAPLHHSTGLVRYVFGTVWFGNVAHLLGPTAAHVAHWLDLIASTRATITNGPDFAFRVAASARMPDLPRLDSLRMATTGGEVIRGRSIVDFEHRFGLSGIVQPAYGLSEATLVVTSADPGDPLVIDERGTVSCGTAMPGVEVRVVHPDGHDCPPGGEGEIVVRGEQLFDGYFLDPQATGEVMRNGWLHTGDIGTLDAAGRLFPRARARALIKRAGVGIAPREIEEPIEGLDDVAGVAAVGVALPQGLTEAIVVVVETTAERVRDIETLSTLVDITVRDTTGARPAHVVLVRPGTIPRTAIGKVRYLELQEQFIDGRLREATLHTT